MKKTPFMRTFNLNVNLILSLNPVRLFGWTLKISSYHSESDFTWFIRPIESESLPKV